MNGNRESDGAFNYTWDAFNRLRTVHDKATGSLVATYHYDALGRRTQKVTASDTTRFIYDGQDVIEERDGTNAVLRQFVHGTGVDQPVVLDRNLDGDNLATGPADQRLYYLQDGLGSVVGLMDEDDNLVEGYLYDAYGHTVVLQPGPTGEITWTSDDVVASSSAFGNPYAFTGQRLDAETGLMYYRARYYDPDTGSFLSRDPAGAWFDALNVGNGYTYAANNPVIYTDSTGEFLHIVAGAGVGCVVGVGISAWKNPFKVRKAAKSCAIGAAVGAVVAAAPSVGVLVARAALSTGARTATTAVVSRAVAGAVANTAIHAGVDCTFNDCEGSPEGYVGAAAAGAVFGGLTPRGAPLVKRALSGAAGGAIGNLAEQSLGIALKNQCSADFGSFMFETAVGAAGGAATRIVPLNAGPHNYLGRAETAFERALNEGRGVGWRTARNTVLGGVPFFLSEPLPDYLTSLSPPDGRCS